MSSAAPDREGPAPAGPDLERLVRRLVTEGDLTGATLSRPGRAYPARPSRVTVMPVMVGDGLRYRFTTYSRQQATDENLAPDAAAERLLQLASDEFRQALLHASDADWQILLGG